MLDLNFVRANLELVEEKLRARGLDPALLLGGFRELDVERRTRITQAEGLQAQRKKLSRIRQRDPVERIGENCSQTSLLGQP